MLESLWLSEEYEAWLVFVNKVIKTVEISVKTFDVPSYDC